MHGKESRLMLGTIATLCVSSVCLFATQLQAQEVLAPQEPPVPQTAVEWLERARIWVGQKNGPGAVAAFEQAIALQDEDPGTAAIARFELGDCYLYIYNDRARALPRYEQVIAESPAYSEIVNSALVRLLEIHAFSKNWTAIDPIASAVVAAGQVGEAGGELVARAMSWKGYMHAELSHAQEIAENRQPAIDHRSQSLLAYTDALERADSDPCVYNIIKAMIDELARDHRYVDAEVDDKPAYLVAAKKAVALVFAHDHPADHEMEVAGKPFVHWRAESLSRLGRLASDKDQVEEAIAWYRLAILDPSNMSELEAEVADTLSELIKQQGEPTRVADLREYLVDPVHEDDPLNQVVVDVLGVSPKPPGFAEVANVSERHQALGLHHYQRQRMDDALIEYLYAEEKATSTKQLAAALKGQVDAHRALKRYAESEEVAERAIAAWRTVLFEADSAGTAHAAIAGIRAAYNRVLKHEECIAVLEELDEQIDPEVHPARSCFLKFQLLMEYNTRRPRAQTRGLAEEILELFLDEPFKQGHDKLCGHTMVVLAYKQAQDGEFDTAISTLSDLKRRFPSSFTKIAELHEDFLRREYGRQ